MKLREIRKQKGITQEKLSELSGVDQTSISNLEIERVKQPTWETAYRLSKALGVSPEDLFPVDIDAA